MKLSYGIYVSLVAISSLVRAEDAVICISTPRVTVQAGSVASAMINNPSGKACEATIKFANPDFLPVNFGLEHISCPGLLLGQITVPLEAPNGDARILWKCANQTPSCSHVWVVGGQENADSISFVNSGELSCTVANKVTVTSVSTAASTTAPEKTVLSDSIKTTGSMATTATELMATATRAGSTRESMAITTTAGTTTESGAPLIHTSTSITGLPTTVEVIPRVTTLITSYTSATMSS